MAAKLERGEAKSAGWADWLARFDLLLFVIAGLSHRYGMITTPDFFWLLGLIGCLAALALLLAIAAFRRLWLDGDRGGKLATRALLVVILIIVPFILSGWQALRLPALNDVATDLDDPPQYSVLARSRRGMMNRIDAYTIAEAEAQIAAFPSVTGRRYGAAPDTVLAAVNAIVIARGWEIAAQSEITGETGETTLEVVSRSLIFGFENDIAIRITDEGETTYVDARSSSRYGSHDLGANARYITSFLDGLDDEVANRAGGGQPADAE
ncbi:MAG: DUF1499 domain-containing protein [Rhizobiaceae bacterium]